MYKKLNKKCDLDENIKRFVTLNQFSKEESKIIVS